MITLVQPSRGHVTQLYGNIQPDGNPHAGQDYAYTNGKEIFPEVLAAAGGVVLFAGDSRGLAWPNIMYLNPDFDRTDSVDSSAGNYIIIEHRVNGVRVALTGYGHLELFSVSAGQAVEAGQRIGTVGSTGYSFGKHLHFDLVLAPFDVDDAPYYGRVDPNPHFIGSLAPAGTITPQEDEMKPEQMHELKVFIQEEIERRHVVTREQIRAAGFSFENKVFIQNAVEARALVTRDVVRTAVATLGAVTPGIDAGSLEKALQDAVARAVADGLAAGVQVDVTVGGK